ncbi:hypothetical protein SAMN04487988_1088 [Algoriphagus hitonicola]|uniref:Uncharacterized protein n=1 Tax=Algoriphagus hitonicola TaxID=435880 RepID=A0A1I2UL86_9BACT|nr:hypothetical protein SAMN04487988_1088 [Algoriphagus hitonicola]
MKIWEFFTIAAFPAFPKAGFHIHGLNQSGFWRSKWEGLLISIFQLQTVDKIRLGIFIRQPVLKGVR